MVRLQVGSDKFSRLTYWNKDFAGLAAYGFCKDRLGYDSDGNLVIEKRDFFVSKVFQPEMMIPAPYPFAIPPLEGSEIH